MGRLELRVRVRVRVRIGLLEDDGWRDGAENGRLRAGEPEWVVRQSGIWRYSFELALVLMR